METMEVAHETPGFYGTEFAYRHCRILYSTIQCGRERRGDNLTTFVGRLSRNSGSLNLQEIRGQL